MAAELLTDASRATDANSNPYAGAKWYFYAAGTLTPQNVYANADLSTSLGAVVTADAGGKFVPIYFNATLQYRGVLKSGDGSTTIYDIDPINSGVMSLLSGPNGAEAIGIQDGGTVASFIETLPSNDVTKYWFAGEYLSTFRTLLSTGSGANITMTGDSTTAGTGLSGGYVPDVHLRSLGRDYGADYLVINNRGQAGKDTADWLSTYLAGDIALATNLYILRWGVNDPDTALKGLTVAQSLANYETALQTIRAAKSINDCSILIMAPNASVGRGRTEAWFREMVEGLRKLARQYECAFFDTFNYTRDALQNIDLGWDDVLADGTMAIHPLAPVSGMIYEEVARVLFAGLGPNKSNHFHNRRGATGQQLTAATLPAAFEYGITGDRAYLAQSFPSDGQVFTFKNNFNSTNALQIFWNNDGPQFRVGGSSWLPWLSVTPMSANVTPATGFTLPGSEIMRVGRTGNQARGMGYVNKTVPATLTSGQVIATVPAGYRPDGTVWRGKLVIFQSSDSTWEEVPCRIYASIDGSTPGQIETMAVSVKTASRVYLQDGWLVA